MHVHTHSGAQLDCRVAVVASGISHALHTGGRPAISLYLRPDTSPGADLNGLCGSHGGSEGVWLVDGADRIADEVTKMFSDNGLDAAAELVLARLATRCDGATRATHPQLRQAVDLLQSGMSLPADLASVARAVALSPDYLGRLFTRQTGVSFSATVRWVRLLTALQHVALGASVTDAAHQAGFTDSSHANRTCWELTGAAPGAFLRALDG